MTSGPRPKRCSTAPRRPYRRTGSELADLGWLGLHISEADGGSGYGLIELLLVVEEHGRALAPGPFVPTVAASAVIAATATADVRSRLLPGLASGETRAAVGLGGDVTVRDGKAYGSPDPVIGGALADLLVLRSGDDAVVVAVSGDGVTRETPTSLDPTRHAAKVALDGAAVDVIAGGARLLIDLTRLVYAAEALGIARACTESAAEYAKIRTQFGRPIAMFQAVKHHCANMLVATELSTAAVWDAAGTDISQGEVFTYAAGIAAVLALPAADLAAQLNIQVHGGIGYTWEHNAHLYLRRATVLESVIDVQAAAAEVADLTARGVRLTREVDLPPEAEPFRDEVRSFMSGYVPGLVAAYCWQRVATYTAALGHTAGLSFTDKLLISSSWTPGGESRGDARQFVHGPGAADSVPGRREDPYPAEGSRGQGPGPIEPERGRVRSVDRAHPRVDRGDGVRAPVPPRERQVGSGSPSGRP